MNPNQPVNPDELDPQDREVYEIWLKSKDKPRKPSLRQPDETVLDALLRLKAEAAAEKQTKVEDRS